MQPVRVGVFPTTGAVHRPRRRLWSVVGRHKLTAGAVLLGVGFLLVNLVLALGQWDSDRATFAAGSGIAVSLEQGEQRIIYMTAVESETLFDFYPSDFACSARGPAGPVAVRRTDHHRLLDGWRDHWSIGRVVAGTSGGYRITCTGHGGAPLVLAAPPRFTVGWASPAFGVMVLVAILLGATLIHTMIAVARLLLRAGPTRSSA